MDMKSLDAAFDRATGAVSHALARPLAFAAALGSILVWAACGPVFGWSDNWQMLVNTGTTVVTFLMAFLLLSASSSNEAAVQLKLSELIRVNDAARNELICVEAKTGAEIADEIAALRDAAAPKAL